MFRDPRVELMMAAWNAALHRPPAGALARLAEAANRVRREVADLTEVEAALVAEAERVAVGGDGADRSQLSAGVHELAAALRLRKLRIAPPLDWPDEGVAAQGEAA